MNIKRRGILMALIAPLANAQVQNPLYNKPTRIEIDLKNNRDGDTLVLLKRGTQRISYTTKEVMDILKK